MQAGATGYCVYARFLTLNMDLWSSHYVSGPRLEAGDTLMNVKGLAFSL